MALRCVLSLMSLLSLRPLKPCRPPVLLLAVLAALCISSPAQGAVQVVQNGFVIRLQVSINAPPAQVYQALLGQVGAWWDPGHTYSGDSRNLSIDARPGGCFCERLPDGGGIEHLRVLYLAPPHALRLSGALGPLQASGLAGALSLALSPSAGGGTALLLVYSVGGFMEGGLDRIGPAADGMLAGQVQRLKRFVETGQPGAAP